MAHSKRLPEGGHFFDYSFIEDEILRKIVSQEKSALQFL